MNWDAMEALFQPAMKASGMTIRAKVKSTVVDLTGFWKPDTRRFDGSMQSRDYEIEYAYADLLNLKEGDPVTMLDSADAPIVGEKYVVREAPTITDDPSDSRSGFFRRAILTKL